MESAPGILSASNADERILVGVHLFGPALRASTRAGSLKLHPDWAAIATPRNDADVSFEQRYAHLRFLPGAYVAPAWTAGQHTYTFTEGLTLSTSTAIPGSKNDNETLRKALGTAPRLPEAVRAHGLGRQLDAAARLAAQASRLGLKRVSLLTTLGGFGAAMDERRRLAMAQLGESLAAFQEFTTSTGLNDRVLVYTDSEVPQALAVADATPAHVVLNAPEGLFAAGYDAGLASWIGLA